MTIKQLRANNALLERALGLAVEYIGDNSKDCDDCPAKDITGIVHDKSEEMYPCKRIGCSELFKAHFIKQAGAKGRKG